jgi:hypothetical protein
MSANQKPSPSKKWNDERLRYTWHLRPPFDTNFDRSHWWERELNDQPINAVTAVYEVARRHPSVCAMRIASAKRQRSTKSPPPSLHWTSLVGLKSWAALDYSERENWGSCAGNLKGVDFRDTTSQCQLVKLLAHGKIIDKRKEALRVPGITFEELSTLARESIADNPITADEWETAIAEQAIQAHRQGRVLLSVAPDLDAALIQAAMGKKLAEHLSLYGNKKPRQRARWEDWLPIIAEFENAEDSPHKAKAQIFARYRRIIDGIQFT